MLFRAHQPGHRRRRRNLFGSRRRAKAVARAALTATRAASVHNCARAATPTAATRCVSYKSMLRSSRFVLQSCDSPHTWPAFCGVVRGTGDYAGTKSIMAGASIGVIGLMLGGFFMCVRPSISIGVCLVVCDDANCPRVERTHFSWQAFCFFGPQLLDVLHTVTGGRYGKRHVGMQKLYTTDWDEQVEAREGTMVIKLSP